MIDTSVLVAAVRSRQGASFALIRLIPDSRFETCLAVGLYTEWQEVLTGKENIPVGRTPDDARHFLHYLASQCRMQEIHFLWRPFLPDAEDDMVLELAFSAGCRYVVTHNIPDFVGSERLGISAIRPRDFLNLIRTEA